MRFFILLTLFLTLKKCESASFRFSVRFVKYVNPTGDGSNGQCCDGRWRICQKNGCDHYFKVCLSNQANKNVDDCLYGKQISSRIPNQNSIDFFNSVGNLTNPIEFEYTGSPTHLIYLKVEVWDKDRSSVIKNNDDFVDFLKSRVPLSKKNKNTRIEMRSRTNLKVEVKYDCGTGYYGEDCEVYCKPPGPTDKYTCGKYGEKNCFDGYIAPDCNTIRQKTTTPMQSTKITTRTTTTKTPTSTSTTQLPTTRIQSTTEQSRVLGQRDCEDLRLKGKSDGFHFVYPTETKEIKFPVFCDMTVSGGWTVIQQRVNGLENFYRNWNSYVEGFGLLRNNSDFWIGLKAIHQITSSRNYRLRITLNVFGNVNYMAEYASFNIGGQSENYKLNVSGFTGSAGDAFRVTAKNNRFYQNNRPFSTYDNFNKQTFVGPYLNCAKKYQSGWWYNACHASDLNGVFQKSTGIGRAVKCDQAGKARSCITWATIPGYAEYSLQGVKMEIMPN